MPQLSVLLPYHNAEDTLEECLESVCVQGVEDFELLAVNDHSTDASRDLVRRWLQRDARVRDLGSEGKGLVAALNTGLRRAKAPVIVRMDADDRMLPGRLDAHLRHFHSTPGLHLSAVQVRMFPDSAVRAGYRAYLEWQNRVLTQEDVADEIFVEAPFAHPAVAFRRETVLRLGGYRDGDFPEDYELWLRLFRHGARMEKIPEVLMEWRESDGRLSRRDPRYGRAAFDRLRARHLARLLRDRAAGRVLAFWGAGRRTRRRADHLIGQGFAPDLWIDIDPRKIGNHVQGAPVCGPEALATRPRPFVLVYVANHGARDLIATQLQTSGYRRGIDYLAVG
jgi:glycosyltransferase involved in cell wall biosynthesis